jgi:hypothetical protein
MFLLTVVVFAMRRLFFSAVENDELLEDVVEEVPDIERARLAIIG